MDEDNYFIEFELYGTLFQINQQGQIYRKLNYKNSVKWRKLDLRPNGNGYINIRLGLMRITLSRIMAYVYFNFDLNNKDLVVDHIDRNRLNNNLSNLRVIPSQQNQFNRGADGCRLRKNGRYSAYIRINKRLLHLGTYDTQEEAHNKYLEAKKIHHIFTPNQPL